MRIVRREQLPLSVIAREFVGTEGLRQIDIHAQSRLVTEWLEPEAATPGYAPRFSQRRSGCRLGCMLKATSGVCSV